MATRRVEFKGKAEWCKPWDFQIDREFEDAEDGRGGNYATNVFLDEASVRLFSALGTKAKLKADGKLTVRRYERHPSLGDLGPVEVTGVEPGTPIGNGSDITIGVDVYDYNFKGRPGKALRWVSVHVDNLVAYEKPDDKSRPAPAVNIPI